MMLPTYQTKMAYSPSGPYPVAVPVCQYQPLRWDPPQPVSYEQHKRDMRVVTGLVVGISLGLLGMGTFVVVEEEPAIGYSLIGVGVVVFGCAMKLFCDQPCPCPSND